MTSVVVRMHLPEEMVQKVRALTPEERGHALLVGLRGLGLLEKGGAT